MRKQLKVIVCVSARCLKEDKNMRPEDIAMNEYLKDLGERQEEYMTMMAEEDWLESAEEE